MKLWRKKLKAMSLLELLIVLSITSIISFGTIQIYNTVKTKMEISQITNLLTLKDLYDNDADFVSELKTKDKYFSDVSQASGGKIILKVKNTTIIQKLETYIKDQKLDSTYEVK